MARWATMVKTLREKHENVLLVDSGNAFLKNGTRPELTAETTILGMNYIRYDALNIGQGELSLGIDFLRDLEKEALFPFVSANIFLKETGLPLGEQFLIKEFNGLKVGITGVISPEYVAKSSPEAKNVTIEDPIATLERIVPELRKRSDVVIVLSHLGVASTRTLARKISGIDIAIIGNDTQILAQPEKVGDTLIVENCKKGEYIGVLNIVLDSNGKILETKGSVDKIPTTVVADPEAYRIVYKYKQEKAVTLIEQKKQAKRQELHEDLMKQLQTMSPEEFIEQMQRDPRAPAVALPENSPPPAAEGP